MEASVLPSSLVVEYFRSPFAKFWRQLWKLFPNFSSKHSPFFFFEDGAVLWNQGLGQIAFLKGNRSVTIGWDFGDRRTVDRIVHLTAVRQWDPPHDRQQLTESERVELGARLRERFAARNENIVIR